MKTLLIFFVAMLCAWWSVLRRMACCPCGVRCTCNGSGQLVCAGVTVEPNTVTVVITDLSGACTCLAGTYTLTLQALTAACHCMWCGTLGTCAGGKVGHMQLYCAAGGANWFTALFACYTSGGGACGAQVCPGFGDGAPQPDVTVCSPFHIVWNSIPLVAGAGCCAGNVKVEITG